MITIHGLPVEIFKFPAGEINIRLPNIIYAGTVRITAFLRNSDNVMALLLTVDAVRRQVTGTKIQLNLPYFPYGRQDRVCNHGEALSVSVMATLINSLRCDLVTIYDPHSDVTPALINNCKIISIEDIFYLLNIESKLVTNKYTLVCPDAGMEKKAYRLLKYFSGDMIKAIKHRNLATGKVENIEIINLDIISNKHLLVIDDICDGGATFIELAKIINPYSPASLSLYVTHGIFSKGLDELFKYFDNIYCYYTFLENPSERLTIIGDIKNAY